MAGTLVRKLLTRQSAIFWLVVASGVTLVMWITDTTQTALRSQPAAQHEPDYYMGHFNLTITDAEGAPRQWLEAERMQHFADRTTELKAPLLRVARLDKGEWRVRALRGAVENDQQIDLTGDVTVEYHSGAGDPGMRIRTDRLRVNLDNNTGATDSPVTMEQANARVSAVGMRFDINRQHMQLLAQVRGQYVVE